MIANWYDDIEYSWWQNSAMLLMLGRRSSLDWFQLSFPSHFIGFFHHPDSFFKPCGYTLDNDETNNFLTSPLLRHRGIIHYLLLFFLAASSRIQGKLNNWIDGKLEEFQGFLWWTDHSFVLFWTQYFLCFVKFFL